MLELRSAFYAPQMSLLDYGITNEFIDMFISTIKFVNKLKKSRERMHVTNLPEFLFSESISLQYIWQLTPFILILRDYQ